MGTALGLSFSALVFDLAGGSSSTSLVVDHAFSVTACFLAGAAALAALVAATGEQGPLSQSVLAAAE
jgi:hypothetical protein